MEAIDELEISCEGVLPLSPMSLYLALRLSESDVVAVAAETISRLEFERRAILDGTTALPWGTIGRGEATINGGPVFKFFLLTPNSFRGHRFKLGLVAR